LSPPTDQLPRFGILAHHGADGFPTLHLNTLDDEVLAGHLLCLLKVMGPVEVGISSRGVEVSCETVTSTTMVTPPSKVRSTNRSRSERSKNSSVTWRRCDLEGKGTLEVSVVREINLEGAPATGRSKILATSAGKPIRLSTNRSKLEGILEPSK
jgi:hypothetical protein